VPLGWVERLVDACRRADPVYGGEPFAERHPLQMGRVEVHVVGAGFRHPACNRCCHDVTRGKVPQWVHATRDWSPGRVDEDASLAPHCLGYQRAASPRPGSCVERGWVELHELHIRANSPRTERERQPVACSHLGIGSGCVELATPSGCQ